MATPQGRSPYHRTCRPGPRGWADQCRYDQADGAPFYVQLDCVVTYLTGSNSTSRRSDQPDAPWRFCCGINCDGCSWKLRVTGSHKSLPGQARQKILLVGACSIRLDATITELGLLNSDDVNKVRSGRSEAGAWGGDTANPDGLGQLVTHVESQSKRVPVGPCATRGGGV